MCATSHSLRATAMAKDFQLIHLTVDEERLKGAGRAKAYYCSISFLVPSSGPAATHR